jgi:hypothetical protein
MAIEQKSPGEIGAALVAVMDEPVGVGLGPCEGAMTSASTTSSASGLGPIDKPTRPRWQRSRIPATCSLP